MLTTSKDLIGAVFRVPEHLRHCASILSKDLTCGPCFAVVPSGGVECLRHDHVFHCFSDAVACKGNGRVVSVYDSEIKLTVDAAIKTLPTAIYVRKGYGDLPERSCEDVEEGAPYLIMERHLIVASVLGQTIANEFCKDRNGHGTN